MLSAALLALALATPARAAPAQVGQLTGVVKSFDAEQRALIVDHAGQQVTVHLDRAATVFVEGHTGSLADLQPGAQVRCAMPADGKGATWIEIDRGGRPSLPGRARGRRALPGSAAPSGSDSGTNTGTGTGTTAPQTPASPPGQQSPPKNQSPGGPATDGPGAMPSPRLPHLSPITDRQDAPAPAKPAPAASLAPPLPRTPAPGAPPLVDAPATAANDSPPVEPKDSRGRITSVDARDEKLSLQDGSGAAVQLKVSPETTFFVDGRIGHLADLKPGDEVRTSYQPRRDGNVAAWIEIVRQ